MPVDVSIRFRAESGAAKREIGQLQQEVQELRQQLGSVQKGADTAGTEVKQLGDQSRQAAQHVDKLTEEAREAAIGVTSLGRNIFKTSAEAKRFGVYSNPRRDDSEKPVVSLHRQEKLLIDWVTRRVNRRGRSIYSEINLQGQAGVIRTSHVLQRVQVAAHTSSRRHLGVSAEF